MLLTPTQLSPFRYSFQTTEQVDWRAKQPRQMAYLRLGRSDVLRSLRHKLRKQSQSSIRRSRQRSCEERGSCRRSFRRGSLPIGPTLELFQKEYSSGKPCERRDGEHTENQNQIQNIYCPSTTLQGNLSYGAQ